MGQKHIIERKSEQKLIDELLLKENSSSQNIAKLNVGCCTVKLEKNDEVRLTKDAKENYREDLGASGIVLTNTNIKQFGLRINDNFIVIGHLQENPDWIILKADSDYCEKVFMIQIEELEKL